MPGPDNSPSAAEFGLGTDAGSVSPPSFVLINPVVSRSGTTILVDIDIRNNGGKTAVSAQLLAASGQKLAGINTTSAVPIALGNIDPAAQAHATLAFPNSVPAGTQTLQLTVTHSTGSSSAVRTVTVPVYQVSAAEAGIGSLAGVTGDPLDTTSILSVTPVDCDLKTALVVTPGTIGPNQIFEASRRPDFPLVANEQEVQDPVTVPAVDQGAGGGGEEYLLTWPSPPPLTNVPSGGVWWLRLRDTVTGMTTNALPVYLDCNLVSPYTLGGRRLRDELWAQKDAINLFLAASVTGKAMYLQSVRYDVEWNEGDQTPAIIVKPNVQMADYEQVPRDRLTTLRYSIAGIIRAQDATYEADMIGQLSWALEILLNQKCYETLQLAPGLVVNGGRTVSPFVFSDIFAGNVWATQVETAWEWELIRGTQ